MNEVWKDIVGYEGLYQVSNLGRVKSLDMVVNARNNKTAKRKGRIKQLIIKDGYFSVNLYSKEKTGQYRVNRLVALAFIPNPKNKPLVNHIDEDKLNNCSYNLEWATHKENINYGTGQQKKAQSRCYPLYQMDLNDNIICIWNSACELGRHGYYQGTITNCCNGRKETAYGYKWKYLDIEEKNIYKKLVFKSNPTSSNKVKSRISC